MRQIIYNAQIMSFAEILIIGVGLAMDAFAVSVTKGLSMRKMDIKAAVIIALFFGVFQGGMPAIGYFAAIRFDKYISAIDHWIAFALLFAIGLKAVIETIKEMKSGEKEESTDFRLKWGELFVLAIATSIDALAVGISFAFLKVSIGTSVAVIGIVTLLISFAGVFIGHRFGAKLKTKANLAGGIILILIGLKILLEHLGLISF